MNDKFELKEGVVLVLFTLVLLEVTVEVCDSLAVQEETVTVADVPESVIVGISEVVAWISAGEVTFKVASMRRQI